MTERRGATAVGAAEANQPGMDHGPHARQRGQRKKVLHAEPHGWLRAAAVPHFNTPDKPTHDAFIESLDGTSSGWVLERALVTAFAGGAAKIGLCQRGCNHGLQKSGGVRCPRSSRTGRRERPLSLAPRSPQGGVDFKSGTHIIIGPQNGGKPAWPVTPKLVAMPQIWFYPRVAGARWEANKNRELSPLIRLPAQEPSLGVYLAGQPPVLPSGL